MMENTFACLDIGDFYTKLIIGYCKDEKANILFASKSYSSGVKNGEIFSKTEELGVINSLKEEAEKEGFKVEDVILVLPNKSLNVYRKTGKMRLNGQPINVNVVKRIKDYLKTLKVPDNYSCINLQELGYYLDDQYFGKVPPLNYSGSFLTLDSYVTIAKTAIHTSIFELLAEAQIGIKDVVINSIACSHSYCTNEEREKGFFILDIGATSNSLSFYNDGYFSEIKEGKLAGNYITNNLANALDIEKSEAETIKLYYGSADPSTASKINLYTSKNGRKFSEYEIVSIIASSVNNIAQEVNKMLENFVSNKGIDYPIYLVGGTSNLYNIDKKLKTLLNKEVIFRPKKSFGARNNVYTPSVGAIFYTMRKR